MFREKCCEFGLVLKTHGVKGELIVKTVFHLSRKLKIPGSIFFEIEGLLVPFFIEEYVIQNEDIIQLKLFDINNKTDALRFLNCKVFIGEFVFSLKKQADPSAITGFDIYNQDDECIGKITGIMDIPGNFLLTVSYKDREILVPFNEYVLIDIDKKRKKIKVNIPQGLIELNR